MVCLRGGLRRRAIASGVRPTHLPTLRNGQRLAFQGSSQPSALTRFENEFAAAFRGFEVSRQNDFEGKFARKRPWIAKASEVHWPTHYPPTPGQRGQFGPESWGRLWTGFRRANDVMGFR
jgi:hypothetical protein